MADNLIIESLPFFLNRIEYKIPGKDVVVKSGENDFLVFYAGSQDEKTNSILHEGWSAPIEKLLKQTDTIFANFIDWPWAKNMGGLLELKNIDGLNYGLYIQAIKEGVFEDGKFGLHPPPVFGIFPSYDNSLAVSMMRSRPYGIGSFRIKDATATKTEIYEMNF